MIRTSFIVLVLVNTIGCASCSGSGSQGDAIEEFSIDPTFEIDVRAEPDAELDIAADEADIEDVEEDSEDVMDIEEELPPDSPFCGNGIVDAGEECDDWNRLNGDGCDWLCRLGDGDPAGPPDSESCNFSLIGDPVVLSDLEPSGQPDNPLPFIWTGSEYAAVFWESSPRALRFRRFSDTGAKIGTDQTRSASIWEVAYDLVWTGSDFALFYVDRGRGILFEKLSAEGVPTAGPTLIVADPLASGPSADNAGDGFVLAWLTEGLNSGRVGICNTNDPHTAKIQRFNSDGTTTGLPGPTTIWDSAWGPPDVASGESGFGVGVMDHVEEVDSTCFYRFLHVSDDLSTVKESGFLSRGEGFDVTWTGDEYATSWLSCGGLLDCELCVATFHRTGILRRPPVCEPFGDLHASYPSRIASGCRGYSVLYPGRYAGEETGTSFHALLRTDLWGRPVDPIDDFACCTLGGGSFNLLFTDQRTLKVLLVYQDYDTLDRTAQLYTFVSTE